MRTAKVSLLAAALILSMAARADRLPIPADAPASFRAECGGCHLPYPPALLTAPDWQRVMARLDRHYGDNASLDEKTRRELEAFLVRNAASRSRMAGAGDPPRLTASAWFRREHRKVPESLWRDARVRSAANCGACHSRAEAGSYRGREIALPELREGH
jgi:nitrate/TMAO reductase-like tetraheme cytochrome c subunit